MIIMSVLFMIVGIFIIVSSTEVLRQIVLGVFLIFGASLILSSRSEIFFDAENNSILTKQKILTFNKEKTEVLPELNYIAVVKVKTSQNLKV